MNRINIIIFLLLLLSGCCRTRPEQIPTLPLTDSSWTLILHGSIDQPDSELGGIKRTATFSKGEQEALMRIRIYDGCNNGDGYYKVDGNKLSLHPAGFISELRGCRFEKGISDREYRKALEEAVSYRLFGSRLEIFYNSGKSVLVFIEI